MEPRLKYGELAPDGMSRMRELEHYLNTGTGLEASLLGLVRLRASLMNGCEYCVHVHSEELRKLNETAERIATVAEWRGSAIYTQRERAALAWTEAVTDIQEGHAPDAVYDENLLAASIILRFYEELDGAFLVLSSSLQIIV